MLAIRVFPTLLYRDNGLWKGVNFRNHRYIGDVLNAIRIYNLNEVDELALLDIGASDEGRCISPELVEKISSECMMPLSVGGGISTQEQAEKLLASGAEKLVLCSHIFDNKNLITDIANVSGAQSVVVSVDVRHERGKYRVYRRNGREHVDVDFRDHLKQVEQAGAGEILINSIDRDGTCEGYDLELIKLVSSTVSIPVIALGGAWELSHLGRAVSSGASAITAGSMFVYYGRRRAVLINFPERTELEAALQGVEEGV